MPPLRPAHPQLAQVQRVGMLQRLPHNAHQRRETAQAPAIKLVSKRVKTNRRVIAICNNCFCWVFAGHMHWTCARVINRIPYVTLGSLVDAGYTDGEPCGAFAAVSIGEGIHVEVAGCRPAAFHFPC